MNVRSVLVKAADILFLVRPPLLCASAVFFFVGAISAVRLSSGGYRVSLMLGALPNLALFLLVTAFAFVVNQVMDVRSDAVNKKAFILPSGVASRAEALGLAAGLSIAAALLLRGREPLVVLLVVAGLLLGVAYSVPPLRLKARPIADLAANVAGFGWIGFMMGWVAFADGGAEAVKRSLPYALGMGAMFLNTCIPDEEGDRASGDMTTCVAFGKKRVSLAALILMSLTAAVAVVTREPLCAVAALSSVPGLVAVAVRPSPRNSVVASQLAAAVLLILAGICAPILLAMAGATYLISRVYYARRFGVDYPRMGGAAPRAKA
jgi:chlorophyll synthase